MCSNGDVEKTSWKQASRGQDHQAFSTRRRRRLAVVWQRWSLDLTGHSARRCRMQGASLVGQHAGPSKASCSMSLGALIRRGCHGNAVQAAHVGTLKNHKIERRLACVPVAAAKQPGQTCAPSVGPWSPESWLAKAGPARDMPRLGTDTAPETRKGGRRHLT